MRLAEAEAAYHDLLRGVAVREVVDQNGERIAYTPASIGRLAAYVENLKKRISNPDFGKCGPLRAVF